MTFDWRKKTEIFFDCTELSSAGTVRAVDCAYGLVGTAQLILVNIQSGAVRIVHLSVRWCFVPR